LGSIGSGALLIAADESATEEVIAQLTKAKVPASVMGRTTAPSQGVKLMRRDETQKELPRFDADELTRVV